MTTALLILLIAIATTGCIIGINRDERRQQDRDTHGLTARRRAADAPRSFR